MKRHTFPGLLIAAVLACLHTGAFAADCTPATEIWTMAELETFARTGTCVDGDLTIAPMVEPGKPLPVIHLPLLKTVKGSLSFGGNTAREIRMPALTSVGAELAFSSLSYPQEELTLIDIGELRHVGGAQISVAGAPLLKPRHVVLHDPAMRAKLKFK